MSSECGNSRNHSPNDMGHPSDASGKNHLPYRFRPQVRLSRYSDMKEKLRQANEEIAALGDEVAYWREQFVESLVSDVVALREAMASRCWSDHHKGDLVAHLDEMLEVMRRLSK